jgi:hypothetical protein
MNRRKESPADIWSDAQEDVLTFLCSTARRTRRATVLLCSASLTANVVSPLIEIFMARPLLPVQRRETTHVGYFRHFSSSRP